MRNMAFFSFFFLSSNTLTRLWFYNIITKIHPPFQNPGSAPWRLILNIFWQISSSPPRTANSIFLNLLLVFVVARITHVALPLRADWKINRDHRALLVSSNRDWFAYYTNILIIFTHFLHVYGGETICLLGFWPLGQNPAFLWRAESS